MSELLTSLSPGQLAGLATAAAALIGALVALSKRRPEVAQVLVSSAGEIVIMQRDLLAERDARIKTMETRQDAQDEVLRELRDEVDRLSRSRDEARRDLSAAEDNVRLLTLRVEQLEDQLRQHDIPIPPHP